MGGVVGPLGVGLPIGTLTGYTPPADPVYTTVPVTAPTPDEVHALIAQRPAFTATSTPSEVDVVGLAAGILADLTAVVPPDLPPDLAAMAKWVITLGTAAYVEGAYFPEQQDGTTGAGMWLRQEYTARRAALAGLAAARGLGDDRKRSTSVGVRGSTLAAYENLYGSDPPAQSFYYGPGGWLW